MAKNPTPSADPAKHTLWQSLKTYFTPRGATMLIFGFAAGLPFYMIYQNLSLWLAEAGVEKSQIGLFAWTGFAFSFKFVWAPMIDRMPIPILEKRVGRRRAWMALAQLGVIITLIAMSAADPSKSLLLIALIAIAMAFFAATQDIAIDAWRIEAADDSEQGVMAAMYQYGYRVAIMIAGALALFVAEDHGWPAAYQFMAVLMGVGMLCAIFLPKVEKGVYTPPPRQSLADTFSSSVIGPFQDFFARFGTQALVILLFLALFRMPDFLMGYMTGPLYIDMGYDKKTIGVIRSGAGMFATMGGVFVGGLLVARMSFQHTLSIGLIAQAVTNLVYSWLALSEANASNLAIAVVIDNIAYGMAGTILIAYMSSLTNTAFTATQYALFSSFYALPNKFIGGFSGFMAEALGYVGFFAMTAAIAIPALFLVPLLGRTEKLLKKEATDQSEKPLPT